MTMLYVYLCYLAYRGATYTSQEKLIDIGPIKTIADTEKIMPLPP